ncbi:MAG TPA: hypothetical protein DCM87_08130 [Planctomycetes bacterium]|nr:hypothetical protein [Planctomycetota bacterium]
MLLAVAAQWCRTHRQGVFPPSLIACARTSVRAAADWGRRGPQHVLLGEVLADNGLNAILKTHGFTAPQGALRRLRTLYIENAMLPIMRFLHPRPPPVPSRPSPDIARNSPCPCGSGKKFKKCCMGLVPAVAPPPPPPAEPPARVIREETLTIAALRRMQSHELARLDARRVPAKLHPVLVNFLFIGNELEAGVRVFETVGIHEAIREHWDDAIGYATSAGRADLIRRLLQIPGAPADREEELPGDAQLIVSGLIDMPVFGILENVARKTLVTDDIDDLIAIPEALLPHRSPALGILVARGILPLTDGLTRSLLLQSILEARDTLMLPPDDPAEDWIDALDAAGDDVDVDGGEELAEVRARWEEERAKVQNLQGMVRALETQLRETDAGSAKAPAGPGDAALRTEMNIKLRQLHAEIKERNAERRDLRAKLARAQSENEALRSRAAGSAADADHEAPDSIEESLLAEDVAAGPQPVRVPVFPKDFAASVASLPKAVVGAALRLVGRLAAGDVAAFHGARHLERNRIVMRQRVGLQHRLLFRTTADSLLVIALIRRQDMDRTIKNLP